MHIALHFLTLGHAINKTLEAVGAGAPSVAELAQ